MEFEPLAESKMDRVLSSPNSLAQESLAKKVAEALSEQIVSGRLSPGQRVDLSHYATLWNVSVTPLRDAAKHLESLGLIRVLARRGVFVADLGPKEVKDIFDVRIALETTAARLAATKIPVDKSERALRTLLRGSGYDLRHRAKALAAESGFADTSSGRTILRQPSPAKTDGRIARSRQMVSANDHLATERTLYGDIA